jgi:hypothetical protein
MNIKTIITSLFLLIITNDIVFAKVSTQEASKLGNSLTAIGAEKEGNKAGTIPTYEDGLIADKWADPLKDIFANEKPLFTITAKNIEQYKANLSDGQIALLKKYPDTYKMPIYTTHRTSVFPNNVHTKAKKNATTTELVDGGNGMKNFDETVPFAIPQSGLEVMWNHVSRYRGGSIERNFAIVPVQRDGSFTVIKIRSQLTAPQYLNEGFDAHADNNVLYYFTQAIKAPARLTGNVFLVHETVDQVNEARRAWNYNAGQRRVRRAPQLAYDAPVQASEGLRTTDQLDMFNGAPDRYNWKLVGKKEIYIPYNSYKLANTNVSYKEIVTPGHINQDYTRYELHRTWQVEATLKEGSRHIYGKRVFYIDEDSWQIAIADHYDTHGELWRASEGHALQFVNANTPWYVSNTIYDLFSGRYLVELNNEERNAFEFGKQVKRKSFTPAAIRRRGKS